MQVGWRSPNLLRAHNPCRKGLIGLPRTCLVQSATVVPSSNGPLLLLSHVAVNMETKAGEARTFALDPVNISTSSEPPYPLGYRSGRLCRHLSVHNAVVRNVSPITLPTITQLEVRLLCDINTSVGFSCQR